MLDLEKLKYLVAFAKWLDGEPLSFPEVEKLMMFMASNPPPVSQWSPDDMAGLQSRFVMAIDQMYRKQA